MPLQKFKTVLQEELDRIDAASTEKRRERVIEGFTGDVSPRAIIDGKQYVLFNSNDYLGLRFHQTIRDAEHEASSRYGTSPGAVRFISGTEKIYKDLEQEIAHFHGREDAMVLSSAFAANVGIIHALIKGQAKDTKVSDSCLVLSDELNHRSIIDGIRVANLPKEQREVYKHFDMSDLDRLLSEHANTYKRALVITDGVFSMLGEYVDLAALRTVTDKYQEAYEEGVIVVVDDSHGVGAFGTTGRGTEETAAARADVLIGTFGKAFGADGGYAVADKIVIEYLRESVATYIYSNSVSPGVAGAAHAAVQLIASTEGAQLLEKSRSNMTLFKQQIKDAGFSMASESVHPIQPVLIGDPVKSKELTHLLFERGYIVTNISYPVVPPGKDEIRVQISANHTAEDISDFVKAFTQASKELGILA